VYSLIFVDLVMIVVGFTFRSRYFIVVYAS